MKKGIQLSLTLLLVLSLVLTGCGTGTPSDGTDSATAGGDPVATNGEPAVSDPVPITLITPGLPEMDATNDRVFAELEKRTNVKLTIDSPGWDIFNDRINILASTGDFPDIVACIDHMNRTVLDNWITNGLIIPFSDEMLAAAPNFKRQYDEVPYYQELKIDGEIYFQPIYWGSNAYPNMGLFHVRKDILDRLSLGLPDSLEDIYQAMKKMKSDLGIYGLVMAGQTPNWSGIAGAFGLPYNGWLLDDSSGEYVFANVQPAMLDALKWVKKLYDEGLIDPESPTLVTEQAEQRYFSGQAGFTIFNGGGHVARYQESISKVDPEGLEYLLPAPTGPEGKRGYVQETQFWAVSMISSNAKDPVAAAKFIDFLVSDEGQKFTALGIEGIHYSEDAQGNITLNQEERAKEPEEHWDNGRYHQLAAPLVSWVDIEWQDFWSLQGKDQEYIDWYDQMFNVNQGKYQTPNALMITSTPKWTEFVQISNDLIGEYFSRIVLGDGDPDQLFAEFVTLWGESGGLEASKEMSEVAKKLFE